MHSSKSTYQHGSRLVSKCQCRRWFVSSTRRQSLPKARFGAFAPTHDDAPPPSMKDNRQPSASSTTSTRSSNIDSPSLVTSTKSTGTHRSRPSQFRLSKTWITDTAPERSVDSSRGLEIRTIRSHPSRQWDYSGPRPSSEAQPGFRLQSYASQVPVTSYARSDTPVASHSDPSSFRFRKFDTASRPSQNSSTPMHDRPLIGNLSPFDKLQSQSTTDFQTPEGRSGRFSGWMDKSRVDEFKQRERRQAASSWGSFELPKDSIDADIEDPVTPLGRASTEEDRPSRTSGIMSRLSRRRQERADLENEPRSRDYRKDKGGKGSRRRRNEDEDEDDGRSYKMDKEQYMAAKETRKKQKAIDAQKAKEQAEQKRWQIKLPPYISIANLAKALNVRYEDFTTKMQRLGFKDLSHDYILSTEDAGLVAMEYGYDPIVEASSENIVAAPWPNDASELTARPPVVTIMGHVDHGKTTLLDYLRKSSIAAGEFGGITQHIGAFSVPLSSGKTITFLDTPGHAAFLSMRQRGAHVTDIVVLVVAADDGVMPQTQEAIKHAKAAKVPVIVAVNKIDKAEADIERVKQDLSRYDVEIEDYGGDVQVVPVSGKTGQGMNDLEESIILLSEILDHKAPQMGNVEGWILEASTKAHGRVATVLVRRGTMKAGDVFVSGTKWCRIKTLRNEYDAQVESAGPGTAVEIDGWRDELPAPGDDVLQARDEQHATAVIRTREDLVAGVKLAQDMEAINDARRESREASEAALDGAEAYKTWRQRKRRTGAALNEEALRERKIDGTFVEVASRSRQEGVQEAYFIIKADVEGSVEAVTDLVASLGNARVRANIVRASAGAVTESDVELAHAASAHILAFNTDIDADIRMRAERAGVPIVEQRVIYRVAETVNGILEGLLPDIVTQRVTGEAEVLQAFSIRVPTKVSASRSLLVAGCRVRNGTVTRGSRVRVMRGGVGGTLLYDGVLASLRNVGKDVSEMKKDTECGMQFGDAWAGFLPGDQVQTYVEIREQSKLA